MKKILCLILSFILMICSTLVTFADSDTLKTDIITFAANTDGTYQKLNSLTLDHPKLYDNLITAYKTDRDEFFKISSDEYLYENSENNYIKMKKIKVDTNDINSEINKLVRNNVSQESINRIKDTIIQQKELGNEELEINIYLPDNISSDTTTTLATSNGTTRDTIEEYRNMHSDLQKLNGNKCAEQAEKLKDVIISAAGTVSTTVSIFSTAVSLLKLYCASTNITYVVGTSNDSFWYDIVYDKLIKDTDVYYNGSWLLGCTSYKVWLNYLYTDQYYTSGGKHVTRSDSINKVHYSKNYLDPVATARIYMGGGWLDSPVEVKILNTRLVC